MPLLAPGSQVIRHSKDQEVEWLTRPPGRQTRGAVAQLGERLNGIQEVGGSTPLGSTKQDHGLGEPHHIICPCRQLTSFSHGALALGRA